MKNKNSVIGSINFGIVAEIIINKIKNVIYGDKYIIGKDINISDNINDYEEDIDKSNDRK